MRFKRFEVPAYSTGAEPLDLQPRTDLAFFTRFHKAGWGPAQFGTAVESSLYTLKRQRHVHPDETVLEAEASGHPLDGGRRCAALPARTTTHARPPHPHRGGGVTISRHFRPRKAGTLGTGRLKGPICSGHRMEPVKVLVKAHGGRPKGCSAVVFPAVAQAQRGSVEFLP